MIVVFNCPQCRRTLRADDYFSGKKIQCRTCKTILFVPGAPPVRDGHAPDAMIASPAPGKSGLDQEDALSPSAPDIIGEADTSYGIGSLCLAVFSMVLSSMVIGIMLLPLVLLPIIGKYSIGICLLVGAYATVHCYLFSRHGYNSAIKAEGAPSGKGYASAGKLINKFLMRAYASSIGLLLLAGIITLIFANHFDPMKDANNMLDQLKSIQKQFGP